MSFIKNAKDFLVSNSSRMSDISTIAGSVVKSSNVPTQLKDATEGMVSQITELMHIRETEQTKREEISAHKEKAIAAINAQKEIILSCMQNTFSERASVLQENFKVLDHALENGDVEKLRLALGSMVQVIQTSPFQAIQQIVESKGTLRLE